MSFDGAIEAMLEPKWDDSIFAFEAVDSNVDEGWVSEVGEECSGRHGDLPVLV